MRTIEPVGGLGSSKVRENLISRSVPPKVDFILGESGSDYSIARLTLAEVTSVFAKEGGSVTLLCSKGWQSSTPNSREASPARRQRLVRMRTTLHCDPRVERSD